MKVKELKYHLRCFNERNEGKDRVNITGSKDTLKERVAGIYNVNLQEAATAPAIRGDTVRKTIGNLQWANRLGNQLVREGNSIFPPYEYASASETSDQNNSRESSPEQPVQDSQS